MCIEVCVHIERAHRIAFEREERVHRIAFDGIEREEHCEQMQFQRESQRSRWLLRAILRSCSLK